MANKEKTLPQASEAKVDVNKPADKNSTAISQRKTNAVLAEIRKRYEQLSPEKKLRFEPLIQRLAFLTVALPEIEKELSKDGIILTYDNGGGQTGKRVNPAAQMHVSFTKNMVAITKQLDAALPNAAKEAGSDNRDEFERF